MNTNTIKNTLDIINRDAIKQGWHVAYCTGCCEDEYRLERSDEAEVFSGDVEAMKFAAKTAKLGNAPAILAITFLHSVGARDAERLERYSNA